MLNDVDKGNEGRYTYSVHVEMRMNVESVCVSGDG